MVKAYTLQRRLKRSRAAQLAAAGPVKTYAGLNGTSIRVPADTIAPVPDLERGAREYPFAAIADSLGHRRDEFARLVQHAPLYRDAKRSLFVNRLLARAGVPDHF
jgi:hypothetical protein